MAMDGVTAGKWGVLALGLALVGSGGAFACTTDMRASGSDDLGTGGNPPGSGGASDGPYVCNEELTGSGGAIGLFNCDHWLGLYGEGALDFSCGQGGEGGEGGASTFEPALQRVCEAGSHPDFNGSHPVYFCLDDLTDDVCSPFHEARVTACLTQEAPCNQDLSQLGCAPFLDECPALAASTCYWAMSAARDREFIETCFAESRTDESCDARFMRCAWDL